MEKKVKSKEFLEVFEMFCNIFAETNEKFLVEKRLKNIFLKKKKKKKSNLRYPSNINASGQCQFILKMYNMPHYQNLSYALVICSCIFTVHT